MLSFHVFAALHLRSASSPPRLCVRRLPRPGRGELCVKIPTSFNSYFHSSPKIPAKPRQKTSFQISGLRTLSFSVSRKSFICHSYENCRVYTNNSQSGTRWSPISTRHCTQVLSFQTLAHSFALFCTHQKRNSFIFKRFRTLCAKTPGGGVPPSGQGAKEYRGRWNRMRRETRTGFGRGFRTRPHSSFRNP